MEINKGNLASVLLGSIFTAFFILLLTPATLINVRDLTLSKYSYVSSIGCGSDSMGVMLDCNDKVYFRDDVLEPEDLIEGRIYSYSSGDKRILHRLVKCLDNCTMLVFKGDNNEIADPIIEVDRLLGRAELIEYD